MPVFDEQASLEILHGELDQALKSVRGGVELIFVDDGSRDGSASILGELARVDSRVRVITLRHNSGQSAALEAGFREVRGEVTVTLDGDLQNDPADIPRLLAELEHADVVNGVRVKRADRWIRRLSSRIANAVRNRLTAETVTDVGCSLRAMRTDYLRRVKLYRGMHRFLPTLLRIEGARVLEIPVAHRPRRFGRSKYGVTNRLFVGIADLLAVRWMQRRALSYIRTEPGEGRSED